MADAAACTLRRPGRTGPRPPLRLGALLCAVLLALGAGAGSARAESALSYTPPQSVLSPSSGATTGDQTENGTETGAAANPGDETETKATHLPIPGLEMSVGLTVVDLRANGLGVHLKGGTPSQTGALFQVDWVGRYLRLGYARQLYRNALPVGTTLDGQTADAISYDSDQFWSFAGLRPFERLYLGVGLGWERRFVRVLQGSTALRNAAESRFMDGLLADLTLSPPFSLQLRVFQDLRPGFVKVRVGTLQLAFTAAY